MDPKIQYLIQTVTFNIALLLEKNLIGRLCDKTPESQTVIPTENIKTELASHQHTKAHPRADALVPALVHMPEKSLGVYWQL